VARLDVARFDDAGKRVPFAVRALRRTGRALVLDVPDAELTEVIMAAYDRIA